MDGGALTSAEPDGEATRPRGGTWNAICLVVGGETFEWSRHDVFTIPHWTWATHEAIAGEADLFVVTDRAVHERLDLVRQELR